MLIVNADDWGRSRGDTDSAMACYAKERITSVTAMVFMEDSERAADLAKQAGMDVGLHLNLTQQFTSRDCPPLVRKCQDRISRFLKLGRYVVIFYNPFLRRQFRCVYEAQSAEFVRLYDRYPSHVDGHQHMHLCANMLIDGILPRGERVRRNFSFWPGEKGWLNRNYRSLVDRRLARRYRVTDYFFALSQCLDRSRFERLIDLAKGAKVELMTHPREEKEQACLMSDYYGAMMRRVTMTGYGVV